MKHLFLLLIVLSLTTPGKAQNIVSSLKDKTGTLWFTVSGRGVFRYDGKTFVNFTKENYSQDVQLSACIYEDQAGLLWFTTDKGLCYYDGKSFTLFPIAIPPASAVSEDQYRFLLNSPVRVWKMMQDKNKDYWFLSVEHGVYHYSHKLRDSLGHEKAFTSFVFDEVPNCILETKKGELFVGSWAQNGVYRFEGTYRNGAPVGAFKKMQGFSDGMIACMLEDKAGNIWVGTRNFGIDRYDGRTITNFGKKDGLTVPTAYTVLEDTKGNIWVGGDLTRKIDRGDVFLFNGSSFTNVTANAEQTKMEGFLFDVKSLTEDNSGNIWIGAGNGFLLRYNPSAANSPGGKAFIDFSGQILD